MSRRYRVRWELRTDRGRSWEVYDDSRRALLQPDHVRSWRTWREARRHARRLNRAR